MKIADIHSFFVRRVTSGKKVSKVDHIVEASKDSLDEQAKQQRDSKRDRDEDAAIFEHHGDGGAPKNEESKRSSSIGNDISSTHLDWTV